MTTTTTPGADAYTIPQEFQDFRDTIRDLVKGVVAPRAAEIDAKAEYPWDVRKLLAERGVQVLSGERFYWASPHLGRQHLRMALLRDPDVVVRAGQVIAGLAEELGDGRSRR